MVLLNCSTLGRRDMLWMLTWAKRRTRLSKVRTTATDAWRREGRTRATERFRFGLVLDFRNKDGEVTDVTSIDSVPSRSSCGQVAGRFVGR